VSQVHSDYSSAESLTTGSLQRHAVDEISNQHGVDRRMVIDGRQCGGGGGGGAGSTVPTRMTVR